MIRTWAAACAHATPATTSIGDLHLGTSRSDNPLAGSVNGLDIDLLRCAQWDYPHAAQPRNLSERSSVIEVVLLGLHEWPHIPRRNQTSCP